MSNRRSHELFRAFNRWGWDARGWSPTTRYRYYITTLRAEGWLREHRQTSLVWSKPADLKAFLFAQPPTARTRNNIRQALVAAFEFFIEQGMVDVNAALSLPRLPEPVSLPKALDAEQAARILAVADTCDPMVAAMVNVLAYGGLRATEARTLEWRHVEPGWLRFAGKRQKERAVPMHPRVEASLKRWRAESISARWVFPSPRFDDRPVSYTWMKVRIREIGAMAGVPGLHAHLLRHTAATRLVETGSDLRTVQEYLGHADPKTTSIYVKVRPARLAEAVGRMEYRPQEG